MSFNLKGFLAKQAANSSIDQVTEGQLDNNNKNPDKLQENQLDSKRGKVPSSIIEKQLSPTRVKNTTPDVLTEVQISGQDDGPNVTSEKQLEANREDASTAPVEKRLDAVRESSFNLKNFFKMADKEESNQLTEGQLGKRKDSNIGVITDKQLEGDRSETKPVTTQALLEKARTGEGQKLTEAMMDESKSSLVKHRNPEVAYGNIPKLEEQRLAHQKSESEKYEAASTTDKKLMLPEVEGKDGLKTASINSSRMQKTAQFDEPFDIGFLERETPGWNESDTFERIRPDVESLASFRARKKREELEDESLIDAVIKDVDVPSDDELSGIDEEIDTDEDDNFVDPAEAKKKEKEDVMPGGKSEVHSDFVETFVQDVDVGTSQVRQITLSFNPDNFENRIDVKDGAVSYLFTKYPSLFSFKVGRNPIEISKTLTIRMDEGKVMATIPTAAFQPKKKQAS